VLKKIFSKKKRSQDTNLQLKFGFKSRIPLRHKRPAPKSSSKKRGNVGEVTTFGGLLPTR